MQDAARVPARAVAVDRHRRCADGARRRDTSAGRHRSLRAGGGSARANVALLLLLLMPLGLLHRALPGLCRYGQPAVPVWRILWPTILAAAPPAPPPRLS